MGGGDGRLCGRANTRTCSLTTVCRSTHTLEGAHLGPHTTVCVNTHSTKQALTNVHCSWSSGPAAYAAMPERPRLFKVFQFSQKENPQAQVYSNSGCVWLKQRLPPRRRSRCWVCMGVQLMFLRWVGIKTWVGDKNQTRKEPGSNFFIY